MIQMGSYLNVMDNSGAKDVCCIKVPKGYRRRYAFVGDIVTASVKSIRKNKKLTTKVQKGEVVKALIVRTRSINNLNANEQIQFLENNVILLTKQNKLIGTRIFGSVPKKFKTSRFLRLASLSQGIIK